MSFMPIQTVASVFSSLGLSTGRAYEAHCLIWFCSETEYGWCRAVLVIADQPCKFYGGDVLLQVSRNITAG